MASLRIQKVFVAYKKSVYSEYLRTHSEGSLRRLFRKHPSVLRRVKKAHRDHQDCLRRVIDILEKKKLQVSVGTRHQIRGLKGFDLIVTVGGDGTFLRTSHEVESEPMLGVNSSPGLSVGALLTVTANSFSKKMDEILKGKATILNRCRLQISINGRSLKTQALNDVLIANNCPAGTSRYILRVGGHREDQKSSGIWIASASGSTAAIAAAGGVKIPPTSASMEYLVREPVRRGLKAYRLGRGIVKPRGTIEIMNKMPRASLFIDGMHRILPLKLGDTILIRCAPAPLCVIS